MKRLIQLLSYTLLAALLLGIAALHSCKPDKPDAPQEENLVISIDPTPTNPVRAMGATYDFRVKVESKMPLQGIDVSVVYRKDSDNSIVFNQPYSTTTTPLNVTITAIPFNEVGTVTVVATSKTKATNTTTQTFKLVRK